MGNENVDYLYTVSTSITTTITVTVETYSSRLRREIKEPPSKEEFFNLLDLLHTMIYVHYANEDTLKMYLVTLSYLPEEISELITFTLTYEFGYLASSDKHPEYISCTRFYEHFIAQFYT